MTTRGLMSEFPPSADRLVTIANWRTQPFNDWSYHNVRRLLPTADIPASANPSPLSIALRNLGGLSFEGALGNALSLTGWLRATKTNAFIVMRQGQIVM